MRLNQIRLARDKEVNYMANEQGKNDAPLRRIVYFKKGDLNMDNFKGVSKEAQKVIEDASPEQSLVLRISINSPVRIEAAAPLTKEGIRKVIEGAQ